MEYHNPNSDDTAKARFSREPLVFLFVVYPLGSTIGLLFPSEIGQTFFCPPHFHNLKWLVFLPGVDLVANSDHKRGGGWKGGVMVFLLRTG